MTTLLLNDDQNLIDTFVPLNVAREREVATMLPIHRRRPSSHPVPSQASVLTIEDASPRRDILGRMLPPVGYHLEIVANRLKAVAQWLQVLK